jgi:HSP20 family protein
MPSSVLEKSQQKSGEQTSGESSSSIARRTPWPAFPAFQRLSSEMDRLFDELGFGPGWLAPMWRTPAAASRQMMWAPAIDVVEKDGQIIVRADLPGMKRDEIRVQLTDEGLTIEGERKRETEETREGVYRSERSYGSFCRVIPLPEGIDASKAKATFKDGVLEVSVPVTERPSQGRRIDIEG